MSLSKAYIFDIETNGLLDTLDTIHSLVMYDVELGITYSFTPDTMDDGIQLLSEADMLIGHNIIGFDLKAIKKVYPSFDPEKYKCMDTLVCSRLMWPDIKAKDFKLTRTSGFPNKLIGSHSLEAWGYRLDILKGDFGKQTDWSEWSMEMQKYCEQDVVVTKAFYELILKKNYSEEAINLEHEVAHIIEKQIDYGFKFNVKKAGELYASLAHRRQELEDELIAAFPDWYTSKGLFTPKTDNKRFGYVKDAPFTKVEMTTFNPASRQHIGNRFIKKYEWKPKVFTETGVPEINESILGELPFPEAKLLNEYLLINKRIGQLAEGKNAWLKLEKNGRIHGRVITNGAVSGRMTHINPNVAQVPSVRALYGKECRELFEC